MNLLVSYVCFDICGGIERASSRGHRARMQFPQKFCPLYDKQVIASALWQVRINSFVWIRVKLILNCLRAHAITHTNRVGMYLSKTKR